MRTVVFDLETIANPEMIPHLPVPEAKANLKDPDKIEADIVKKRRTQLEEMAVSPELCLVACASFKDMGTGKVWSHLLDPEGQNEKRVLKEIWQSLYPYERFVTFNGIGFDAQVLKFRSMHPSNRVPMSVTLDQNRYRPGNHIDVRMILTGGDKYKAGNMDYWARMLLGKPGKAGMSGKDVGNYWELGLYNEVQEYCESDVEILSEIYEVLVGYLVDV